MIKSPSNHHLEGFFFEISFFSNIGRLEKIFFLGIMSFGG